MTRHQHHPRARRQRRSSDEVPPRAGSKEDAAFLVIDGGRPAPLTSRLKAGSRAAGVGRRRHAEGPSAAGPTARPGLGDRRPG